MTFIDGDVHWVFYAPNRRAALKTGRELAARWVVDFPEAVRYYLHRLHEWLGYFDLDAGAFGRRSGRPRPSSRVFENTGDTPEPWALPPGDKPRIALFITRRPLPPSSDHQKRKS